MYLYTEADSLFHRLHPVSKLLTMMALVTTPFFVSLPIGMAGLLALYAMLLLAGKGGTNLAGAWKLLIVFWIFTFLIWVVIPRLRHQPWSYESATMLATRVDVLVLAGLWFVTVTRIEEFTLALTRLGLPYKPAFTLSLGFRLVPLFYQNLQTIAAAQQSRGVDLESGGLFRKAQQVLPMIGILLSYGIRNAEMMAMSLEAKGFGYSPQRTSYLHPRFSWRDALCLCGGAVLVIVAILLHR
jgi:energy-coupling factor transport system permease protein